MFRIVSTFIAVVALAGCASVQTVREDAQAGGKTASWEIAKQYDRAFAAVDRCRRMNTSLIITSDTDTTRQHGSIRTNNLLSVYEVIDVDGIAADRSRITVSVASPHSIDVAKSQIERWIRQDFDCG